MAKSATEKLPEWDLSAFYSGIDDPRIKADLQTAKSLSESFAQKYRDVSGLGAEGLANALADYEKIQDLTGKIGSYAGLMYAKYTTKPEVAQFYQNTDEALTELGTIILFFTLAINKLEDQTLEMWLSHPRLKHYESWIRDVRAYKPYQLPDDMEKLLLEKSVAGRSAWIRLFDETLTAMRFKLGRKELTEPEIMELMSHKSEEKRKAAALSIGEAFKAKAPLFAHITNTLAKDKDVEDKWRGFKAPISSRNVSNYIEDEVVEALLSAVQKNYANTAHRYYKVKAKWLGKDALEYWDRNAPLPFAKDRKYSWDASRKLVLTSFKNFSPTLGEIGKQFFDKNWIDAPVLPGKSPGAFSHPTVPSVHPCILLNHLGKSRDVMTLAHELGHGVHQVLSAKQGALMCDTPLTLAETASVFGEQLTFQQMVAKEKDEVRKKALIAGKVEDMINTVVRQTAFCLFEKHLHDERKKGEVSADRICEIWMQVQSESLGSGVKLHGDYKYFWTYIPHFIHTPFYVYAYAFGDCLVNSLYAVYEQEKAAGRAKEFEQKYIAMLEAGGTKRHKELLAPFGLDASRPDFWEQGLSVISGFIDKLEKLS